MLKEAGIGDTITQLILPSDEWYYTNHSTKYAKYVKHHAARILVYLGMHNRLANRVSLFEILGKYRKCVLFIFFFDRVELAFFFSKENQSHMLFN